MDNVMIIGGWEGRRHDEYTQQNAREFFDYIPGGYQNLCIDSCQQLPDNFMNLDIDNLTIKGSRWWDLTMENLPVNLKNLLSNLIYNTSASKEWND